MLAGLLVVACDDDEDEPSASPTIAVTVTTAANEPTESLATTTTATLTPEPGGSTDCPIDASVCDLAGKIDTVIAAGDYAAVVTKVKPADVQCPGEGTLILRAAHADASDPSS